MFFLLIAITQFFPVLKVGYLFTYIAPLVLVLTLTMGKEAYDDFKRYQRDREANNALYKTINENNEFVTTPSCDLKVGDVVEVVAGQRIPADLVLLYTSNANGAVFISTDQLDGETDWKLRKGVKYVQEFVSSDIDNNYARVKQLNASVKADIPRTQKPRLKLIRYSQC